MSEVCLNVESSEVKSLYDDFIKNLQLKDPTMEPISMAIFAADVMQWREENPSNNDTLPTVAELIALRTTLKSKQLERKMVTVEFSPLERSQRVRYLANAFVQVMSARYDLDKAQLQAEVDQATGTKKEALAHNLNMMEKSRYIVEKYGVNQVWQIVKLNYIDNLLNGEYELSEEQKGGLEKVDKYFYELADEASPLIRRATGISISTTSDVVRISDDYQENEDEITKQNDSMYKEETSNKEDFDFDSSKVSGLDTCSPKIKAILSTITRLDSNGNVETDDFGVPYYIDMDIAHGVINSLLQDIRSVDKLIPMLEDNIIKYPWLQGVVNLLNKDKSLRNLFFFNFNKTHIRYNIVNPKDNTSTTININRQLSNFTNEIQNNIMRGIQLSSYSIYDSNGNINYATVKQRLEEIIKFKTDYNKSPLKRLDTLTKDFKENLNEILRIIGFANDPVVLESILSNFKAEKTTLQADPVNKILDNVIQILSGLSKKELAEDIDLVTAYKSKYNAIVALFRTEESFQENSFRQNGDSHQSFMLSNYLSKIRAALKGEDFQEFVNKYLKFDFFNNSPLWETFFSKIINQSEARKAFNIHNVMSDRNGKEYLKWTFLDTIIVRLSEFGALNNSKSSFASFMVPTMSDAPTCYFMTLPKIQDTTDHTVKDQVIEHLTDLALQEYQRIVVVRARKEAGVNPIHFYDIDWSKDGKGGAKFCFLNSLNTYEVTLEDGQKELLLSWIDKMVARKQQGEDVDGIIIDTIRQAVTDVSSNEFKNFISILRKNGAFNPIKEGGTQITIPTFEDPKIAIRELEKKILKIRDNLQIHNQWNDEFNSAIDNLENLSLTTVRDVIENLQYDLRAKKFTAAANTIQFNSPLLKTLEDYFYNDLIAINNIYQLLTGDIAFYKDPIIDLSKRMKEVQGATSKFAFDEADRTQKVISLTDSIVSSGSVKELTNFYNNAVTQGLITKERAKQLIEDVQNINETDGQSFMTLQYYKKLQEARGNWNNELERVYNKMLSTEPQTWTVNDYSVLFQIMKPFVYTQRVENEFSPIPYQNKNSIMVLTPQYVKGKPKLEALLEFMNEENINISHFESAVKVGDAGRFTVDGNTTKQIKKNLKEQLKRGIGLITEFDAGDFGQQVSTVPHYLDTESLVGSQLRKVLLKDTDINEEFIIGDTHVNIDELQTAINNLTLANQEAGLVDVQEVCKTQKSLSDELVSGLREDGRFGPDAIRAVSMASDNKMVLPPFTPSRASKIEARMIALIKNKVSAQKMAGGALIQATSFGLAPSSSKIKYTEKYHNTSLEVHMSEDGKSIDYIDCLVPAWSKELFAPLIDPETGLLDINKKNEDGLSIIPESIKRLLVFRMPTENNYSILPLRVKGFLPQQAGGAIITNPIVFYLTGSDLDVDKLFFLRPSFKTERTTSNKLLKAVMDKFFPNQKTFKLEDTKEIDRLINQVLNDEVPEELSADQQNVVDFIKAKSYLANTYIKALEYQDITTAYIDADKRVRDNALFDAYWAIITSRSFANIALQPGNFDGLRKAAKIATILNDPSQTIPEKFDDLMGKSEKELESQIESKQPLAISPVTVVQTQIRNTVGKELIPTIANNMSHYSATQGMGLKINSSQQIIIDDLAFNDVSKTNVDSRKVSVGLSEYSAAVVDNAKDPVLGEMGIAESIMSALALARSGFQPHQIMLFFQQPAIKRVIEAYNRDPSEYKTLPKFIGQEIENYKKIIAQYPSTQHIPDKTPTFTTEGLYKNIRDSRLFQAHPEEKTKKDDLSYPNYLESQLTVLFALNRVVTASTYLSDMILVSKFDTTNGAPSRSFANVIRTMLKLKKFYNSHIQNKAAPIQGKLLVTPTEGLGEATKETIKSAKVPFIQGFYSNTYGVLAQTYGKYIPYFKPTVFSALEELSVGSQRGILTEKEISSFFNDWLTYRITRLPEFGTEILADGTVITADEKRRYFINKFPSDFEALKAIHPELQSNPFIHAIKAYRASKTTFKSPTLLLQNSGGLNIIRREVLTNGWRDLLSSEDEEIRKLAINLFKYAFYKSGLGFNPTSWMHLVPTEVEFSLSGYRDELYRIQEEEGDEMNPFINQFILNHAEDKNLIRYSSKEEGLIFNKQYNEDDNTVTLSREEVDDVNSPYQWLIVAYTADEIICHPFIVASTSASNNTVYRLKQQDGTTIVYEKIERLGEKNNYLEYSYGAGLESIHSQIGQFSDVDNAIQSGVVSDQRDGDITYYTPSTLEEASIKAGITNDMPIPTNKYNDQLNFANFDDAISDEFGNSMKFVNQVDPGINNDTVDDEIFCGL